MELQDKEKEYKHSVWEIYRKEWETASNEKRIELNKGMRRWQELMKSGLTAQQAYYKAMEEESGHRVAKEPLDKRPAISSSPPLRKAPLIFLSLALVAAIVYSVVITGDRNALNTELESVQSDLTSTQAELSSTKQTLTSLQSELDSTQSDLKVAQADLTSTKSELASTQSDLSSTKQSLASTQADLGTTRQTLASVQSELGATEQELATTEAERLLYKETLDGLRVEVYSGKQPLITGGWLVGSPNLKNNSIATNPTWWKLKEFLLDDPTDDEYYHEYSFNCVSFAEMLHNNAEAAGIRAAFVGVNFRGEEVGHALNAFMTTNKGLVYVDCSGPDSFSLWGQPTEYDKIAYVMKGKKYHVFSIDTDMSPNFLHYEENYYEILKAFSWWEPMGTVKSIGIYW